MNQKWYSKPGWVVTFVGLGIIFFPVLVALPMGLFSSSHSMWNEGEGGGAALWLLFLTVPIGLLVMIIGWIVVGAQSMSNNRKVKQNESNDK